MKYNKFFYIILLIILLISITTVQAIDENQTCIEQIDDTDSETVEVYFDASAENDGNGSINNPYKNLTADRVINADIIHLANGVYNIDKKTPINEKHIIIGETVENTIITFKQNAFTIFGTGHLSLFNITLKANIYNRGILEATNVIFRDKIGSGINSYGVYSGGAIYIVTQTTTAETYLNNCTFINNTANYGGAIYSKNAILELNDCKFINNSAKNYGGALAIIESGSLKTTINNCLFENEYSEIDSGGAIYSFKNTALTITDSIFNNCSGLMGGALCLLSSKYTMTNCEIKNNKADFDGGAIYEIYCTSTIENSKITNNSAINGAGLFGDANTKNILKNTVFENNTARNYGGAIFLNEYKTFTENNITYANNEATVDFDVHKQDSYDYIIGNSNYTMLKGDYSDENITIPSRYNLNDDGYLTSIKDQEAGGNCWSFATLAALESAILKKTNKTYDFSENNMKNLAAINSAYGWKMESNNGGYYEMGPGYLISWLGPIYEEMDIYSDRNHLSPVFNSVIHVQNYLYLPARKSYTDNDAIKLAVLKYGAVKVSYYSDSTFYGQNKTNYYYNGGTSTNHAVILVGWDDNYSKENFVNTPPGDGAFIIKNS